MSPTATCAFREQTFLGLLVAACVLLCAGVPAAQALTISDGVGSITVNDTTGELRDFTVNGADDLFEIRYYYRTPAMTREAVIIGRFATIPVVSVTQTAPDTITVLGSVTEFDYQLDYVLSGQSVSLSLTVDETNGSPLTLSLFSYQSWDTDNDGGNGDFLSWDGTVMTVTDPPLTRSIEVTATTAPDATEGAAWPGLQNAFEDASITNLVDGAGLPFGPGDGSFAFQYDQVLAANGSTTIDMGFEAVPEPSSGSLTALGLLGLGVIRRRRSAH